MPGIDTEAAAAGFESLPARLAALLVDATAAVKREAVEAKPNAEAIARKVGVIARSGAALALFGGRLQRRAALPAPGEPDPTEEADMDDADEPPLGGEDAAARLERGVCNLSRNLRLGAADGGAVPGAGACAAHGAAPELGVQRPAPPVAA